MSSREPLPPPNEKRLRLVSFVLHASRGLIRDRGARRKTLLFLTVAAVVLLVVGATFLAGALDPKEHPGWFLIYWLAVAWLTLTMLLLALFDLLLVRAEGRVAQRTLAQKLAQSKPDDAA